MTVGSVLISGAGIAGASSAYWLARAGWQVSVVEKAGAARSSGNPVDVRGEAAVIARAMGIWPQLEAAATAVTRLVFVDAAGRPRAVIGTRQGPGDRDEVEIARADLAAVLLAAASNEAEIIVGNSIAALDQDAHGVDVAFESGARRRYDLVLGADGLHSNVRRLAFGPETRYARHFGLFVGTVRTMITTGGPHEVLMFNEPGRSLSIHPAGGSPVAAFIFRGKHGFDHRVPAAGKHLVEQAYAGAGWVAPTVLDEFRASDDVYFDAVTRIDLPSWSRGRIGLIGDAANCLSLLGEGTSNAVVAARTVADALASSDIVTALANYESTHRRRLRRYRRGARLASHFLVPASGPGLALRNAGVRVVRHLDRRTHLPPDRA